MAITIRVDEDGVPGAPGPQGPKGDKGDPGEPGASVIRWFQGYGPPPDFIPGAQPGSMYYDRTDSILYQL